MVATVFWWKKVPQCRGNNRCDYLRKLMISKTVNIFVVLFSTSFPASIYEIITAAALSAGWPFDLFAARQAPMKIKRPNNPKKTNSCKFSINFNIFEMYIHWIMGSVVLSYQDLPLRWLSVWWKTLKTQAPVVWIRKNKHKYLLHRLNIFGSTRARYFYVNICSDQWKNLFFYWFKKKLNVILLMYICYAKGFEIKLLKSETFHL